MPAQQVHKPTRDYYVDSDEEDEAEQVRMSKIAKKMNKKKGEEDEGNEDAGADQDKGKRRKK